MEAWPALAERARPLVLRAGRAGCWKLGRDRCCEGAADGRGDRVRVIVEGSVRARNAAGNRVGGGGGHGRGGGGGVWVGDGMRVLCVNERLEWKVGWEYANWKCLSFYLCLEVRKIFFV